MKKLFRIYKAVYPPYPELPWVLEYLRDPIHHYRFFESFDSAVFFLKRGEGV